LLIRNKAFKKVCVLIIFVFKIHAIKFSKNSKNEYDTKFTMKNTYYYRER